MAVALLRRLPAAQPLTDCLAQRGDAKRPCLTECLMAQHLVLSHSRAQGSAPVRRLRPCRLPCRQLTQLPAQRNPNGCCICAPWFDVAGPFA
jgi:hypothetical protein